jgi:anti-sigma B factor antagonist
MSNIKIEEKNEGIILTLSGQFIGGEETDQLRDTLKDFGEAQKNRLILDMGEVTYLNSTALGVLISAHANFVKRNGKIILCNVSKAIENIFVITKLTFVFNIVPTLDEAIKKL